MYKYLAAYYYATSLLDDDDGAAFRLELLNFYPSVLVFDNEYYEEYYKNSAPFVREFLSPDVYGDANNASTRLLVRTILPSFGRDQNEFLFIGRAELKPEYYCSTIWNRLTSTSSSNRPFMMIKQLAQTLRSNDCTYLGDAFAAAGLRRPINIHGDTP